MVWTNIPNSDIDQDSPVTVALMTALRDNPEAIADGDSGAPRITDGALSTSVTTAGRNWVILRYATVPANAVGSLMLARDVVNTDQIVPGNTRAGSQLRSSNVFGNEGTQLTGTWRALGFLLGGTDASQQRTTLWLKTSN